MGEFWGAFNQKIALKQKKDSSETPATLKLDQQKLAISQPFCHAFLCHAFRPLQEERAGERNMALVRIGRPGYA
jgi:hypothetical protein